MALQSGIVKPLPGSKSIYQGQTKNQIQGARAEAAVIFLLEKKGWSLEFQRCRTRISEIDLIFLKQNQVLLIEVKSLDDGWRTFERIRQKQYQFLQKNLNLFSFYFTNLKVSAFVTWVSGDFKVSFVSIE